MSPEEREVIRTALRWFDGHDRSTQELVNAVHTMRMARKVERIDA